MRRAIIFMCALILGTSAFAEDLVLVNGTIIEGTLKARYTGSLRIRDGEIADMGAFKPAAEETVIDVKGLIVAPGFIDLRSPSRLERDGAKIGQGITTTVLGADGSGPYSVEEFMIPFDTDPPPLNVASFIGHDTVRLQIMGDDFRRPANADEVQRMRELIEDGMRQGAFGFSSDLTREPASFSSTEEIAALARSVGRFGGTYMIFPRSGSIKDLAAIATEVKLPVHLAITKPAAAMLAELDAARAQGADISADVYGYSEPGKVLRAFLQHIWVMILPAQYTLDGGAIPLERAVRKMTGLPASRIGLRERGILKPGAPADVIVFSPQKGFNLRHVFVNGRMAVKDGVSTGARAGEALR